MPRPIATMTVSEIEYLVSRLQLEIQERAQEVADLRGIPLELLDREDPDAEGGYTYPCQVCEENSPIYCEPRQFNPDHHYCGRSPQCCP